MAAVVLGIGTLAVSGAGYGRLALSGGGTPGIVTIQTHRTQGNGAANGGVYTCLLMASTDATGNIPASTEVVANSAPSCPQTTDRRRRGLHAKAAWPWPCGGHCV